VRKNALSVGSLRLVGAVFSSGPRKTLGTDMAEANLDTSICFQKVKTQGVVLFTTNEQMEKMCILIGTWKV